MSQSDPGLFTGQVPTAAQWNSYFAGKQDEITVLPYANLPTEVAVTPVAFAISGNIQASATVGVAIAQPVNLLANFAGAVGYASVASTSNAIFTVGYVRGGSTVAIGTLTFFAGNHVPVFGSSSIINLLIGDWLYISGPASADNTLKNIGITLLASKV